MKEVINFLEFEISLSILVQKTTAFWADGKVSSLSHGPVVGRHCTSLMRDQRNGGEVSVACLKGLGCLLG